MLEEIFMISLEMWQTRDMVINFTVGRIQNDFGNIWVDV